MATLQIENLPDDLYRYLQTFAVEKNVSLNDAVIQLLKQLSQPTRTESIEDRQMQQTTNALSRIRSRSRVNPLEFGLPDSTILIQEDRRR